MLTPGTRLGSYDFQALIGHGGMGEVYRARHIRLNRDVALKILPAAFDSDAERVARFVPEAQALAALKHPHICTVHDVAEDRGTTFLVTEWLKGETLADRLGRGAMSLDEAVNTGTRLAEALHAAHQVGIVPRDVKPANIVPTTSGPKLLVQHGRLRAQ